MTRQQFKMQRACPRGLVRVDLAQLLLCESSSARSYTFLACPGAPVSGSPGGLPSSSSAARPSPCPPPRPRSIGRRAGQQILLQALARGLELLVGRVRPQRVVLEGLLTPGQKILDLVAVCLRVRRRRRRSLEHITDEGLDPPNEVHSSRGAHLLQKIGERKRAVEATKGCCWYAWSASGWSCAAAAGALSGCPTLSLGSGPGALPGSPPSPSSVSTPYSSHRRADRLSGCAASQSSLASPSPPEAPRSLHCNVPALCNDHFQVFHVFEVGTIDHDRTQSRARPSCQYKRVQGQGGKAWSAGGKERVL